MTTVVEEGRREAIKSAVLRHITYEPHPWDNAREGSFGGLDEIADDIIVLGDRA